MSEQPTEPAIEWVTDPVTAEVRASMTSGERWVAPEAGLYRISYPPEPEGPAHDEATCPLCP